MTLTAALLSRALDVQARASRSGEDRAAKLYAHAVRQLERAAELAAYAERIVQQAEDAEALVTP